MAFQLKVCFMLFCVRMGMKIYANMVMMSSSMRVFLLSTGWHKFLLKVFERRIIAIRNFGGPGLSVSKLKTLKPGGRMKGAGCINYR